MNYKFILTLLFFVLFISSCEQVRKATDIIVKPTARQAYERNFSKNDSLLLRWKNAFEMAKHDSLQITLPYSESGVFPKNESNKFEENFNVYSYNVQLKEGERIVVEVIKEIDSALVFVDFFQAKSDTLRFFQHLKSAAFKESYLVKEIDASGYYKILIQPQLNLQCPFVIKIYTEPIYEFPVSGGNNKSIQSFWADPRGDGSRSHEGVDIFAKRGTPVVAVTDGIISSTGERGLGGKQVWLRDGLFDKSIYYAHLDSIAVLEGKKVKIGDTLGFVGNTGNAKTTQPHLHFGIYKTNGAVNPFSFIRKTEIQIIDNPSNITKAITLKNRVDVRKGPASVFQEFGMLKKNDTIMVLGKNQNYFHIKASNGLKGYVSESALKPLPSN